MQPLRLILLSYLGLVSLYAHAAFTVHAPMQCQKVPDRATAICTLSTPSQLMPVDDVVFYKRDESGHLTFLEARKGDVAIVHLLGFSEGGSLTILEYAEEGHPSFAVYRTDDFLDPDGSRRVADVVSRYEIERIHSLTDSGSAIVVYNHRGTPPNTCVTIDNDPTEHDSERCLVRLQLTLGLR